MSKDLPDPAALMEDFEAMTGFSGDNLRRTLDASAPPDAMAPTTLCPEHVPAPGTSQCRRCGRPIQAPEKPSLRDRALEFVVSTFTTVDGKAPSDEDIEKAVDMVCLALSGSEARPEPAFGDPLRIDPLWESRLRVLAAEKGVPPRAYLLDVIRQQWAGRRG